MTQRILLLYTGGTIGMDDGPDGLAPSPGLLPRLIGRLDGNGRQLTVCEYPDLIDSSAVTVAHWNRMIDDIVARRADYDGFVVIHGTDTMAYTASALAFALDGLGKPVVLTGSQLPLVRPRSDGWNNLADALEAACCPDLAEVVVVFDRVMLRGCRARKVDAAGFHGFDSPNCPPLATFGIEPVWQRARWRAPRPAVAAGQRYDPAVRVAAFFLTPGAGAALIGRTLAEAGLDGALLMSYGNGNAPDDPALLAGIRAACAAGTVVVNLTQAVCGAVEPGAYAAGRPLAEAGALPGDDLTPEAALAKLSWLCAQPLTPAERRALIGRNLVGEQGRG